jgi:hypothetical protein
MHTCELWKKGRNSMGVAAEFIEQYKIRNGIENRS